MEADVVSILIPSWRRPDKLEACLLALSRQTRPPDEVLIVWQADDTATRDRAEACRATLSIAIVVLHLPTNGVVPAENLALSAARGNLIGLIDDDAVAPPYWVERYLALFADPAVGAAGGSAVNHLADGTPFPVRHVEDIGRLTTAGKVVGNMYDHPAEWANRPPREVDHLVGYNMWLRRKAFDRFSTDLRAYWNLFELEACLQVKRYGYIILFDYGNVVLHYPSNTAYAGGRQGDLTIKIYNPCFNLGSIHAYHSPWLLLPLRIARQYLLGSVQSPGAAACIVAVKRFGKPLREIGILMRAASSYTFGALAGLRRRLRRSSPEES